MIINQSRENNRLVLTIEGRLDTSTAPELEAVIDGAITGVKVLDLDMEKLEYISSAHGNQFSS